MPSALNLSSTQLLSQTQRYEPGLTQQPNANVMKIAAMQDDFLNLSFKQLFTDFNERYSIQRSLLALVDEIDEALDLSDETVVRHVVSSHATGQGGAYIHVKYSPKDDGTPSKSPESKYLQHAYSILLHSMKVKVSNEEGRANYVSLVKLLKPASYKRAEELLSLIHEATISASEPMVTKRKTETQMGSVTVISSWIVGKQHYCPNVSLADGETVLLERDPANPFDVNAIKVLSCSRQQLGNLSRQHASELAPMLDNGEISDITSYIAGGGNKYNTPIIITYEKELKKRAKITKQ
jgi:hypothetical protein